MERKRLFTTMALVLVATFVFANLAEMVVAQDTYTTAIKQNREGKTTFVIRDKKGAPWKGMKISYRLIQRDFLFGYFDYPYNPVIATTMKDAGFNFVTAHLNWKMVEPQQGKFDWAETEYAYDLVAYKKLGFTVKAHAITWFEDDRFPSYLRGKSYEQIKGLAASHVRTLVQKYKNYVDIWEAMNEATAGWANELNFTEDQFIDLIKQNIAIIRQEDPTAKIIINHASPSPKAIGGNKKSPLEFVKRLQKENVKYDIIGLQCYYDPTSDRWGGRVMTLQDLSDMVDSYATIGLDIHITELSVPSGPTDYTKAWTPAKQSEWVEKVYTMFYSKPSVKSITWWDASDRGAFITNGGLLYDNNSPKPAYNKLKQIFTQKWYVQGQGKTNPDGEIVIDGPAGTYEVSITDPATNLTKVMEIVIE